MSEISKFYLSRKQFQNFESGSLFKYDGDNLSHIERPRYMKLTTSIPEDWKTIPPLEAFYLKGKFVEQRDNLLKKRFFNKISLLKKDDKCYYINGNIIDKCTICDHIEKNDELHFIIETKDGTKKVPAYDIQLEDEDVVRAPITEYYLLIDKYFDYEPGTLIVYKSGKIFTYKEKQKLVGCIEDLQKISVPISLNYAEFLHKFPVRDRSFKVLQEIQADLQYARGDRFDYLKVTHSFKVEEIVNFTKDDYVKLESLSKEDKIDYFESDIYISWTCVALEKLQSKLEANDFLALNFTQLSLQIVCKTMRKSKTFIRMVKDNANFMKKLACLFDYMAKKEKLTYKESDLLCTILSMYWCILRVEKPLDNSIFDNLKHIFYYRDTTYENKLGAALCLTNLIDAQSSLSEDLIKYFIECSDRKSLEPFSCEEVFIGLGKQQFKTEYNKINIKDKGGLRKSVSEGQALQEPDNVDNSINVLTNSFTCGQSPNITDDTHHHLKFLYEYQSKIECNYMNKFIDVTQHFVKIILNNLGKEKGELNNKVVRDCAMTALSVFCDLLDSDKCFPKMVADNNSLMCLLKGLFETLANGDKPISMEVQFLENIIFIYWNILKSIKEIKFEPITETMEKCYSGSKFNIQIKIAAAMCLTSLRKHPSQLLKEIKPYLINLCERDSRTEAFGFSNADFTTAIGNISLITKSSSIKFSDNVEKSLIVLKDLFTSPSSQTPNITEDTHSHFKIIYENNVQICGEYMDEFIDITKNVVNFLFDDIYMKGTSENKVFLDCAMTDLTTVCDLCDSNLPFVSKVVGNNFLMNRFKGICERMAERSELSSLEKQFLEMIIFIYWNIIKSGEKMSLIPSVVIFEKCFNNHNLNIHIRTAAALSLALLPGLLPPPLKEIKLYLMNLCKKYSSGDIHGFPIGEIYMAFGKISLNVDVSDNKKTDDVEGSLSVITSTFKFGEIPDITEDTHNHFKILYTNQLQIVEKYMNKFIDVTRHFVDIILKHIKCKRLVIEDKMMRDCSMTDLSIFCDLCDSNEDFVAKVVANTGLMNSIKGLLENLAGESRPTSMQIQFLENTIFIFWNILKFGESMDSLPSIEKMKNCYDNNNMSIQIKTAAALCIAYAYHDSEELCQQVSGYLTKCIKYESRKIHGFPRGEIYTALGKVYSVKCKDQDQLKSKSNLSQDIAAVPKEDYERCLEIATENMQPVGDVVFECIIKAIRMDNNKISLNFISKSAKPINLQQCPSLLPSLIDIKCYNVIKSLLGKCEASTNDYPQLIELAGSTDSEIVNLAVYNIDTKCVNESTNKQLLSLAYSRLSANNTALFKAIIDRCSNKNALLDENDTFLTKVIRQLTHEQLNDALSSAAFDVSVRDGNGLSPLCVACTLVDEVKIGILIKHGGITPDDKENALVIIYRDTTLDGMKRSRIVRIINGNAV